MQSQLFLILIWDVTNISSAPLQEKGNTTYMCSLTFILKGLVFYTRPEHLPVFITSFQDSVCLISTVVDIRFNRYADSSAKLVTEQSKLRILVVSEYNETSTIKSAQPGLTQRPMNYSFPILKLRFKIHIKLPSHIHT